MSLTADVALRRCHVAEPSVGVSLQCMFASAPGGTLCDPAPDRRDALRGGRPARQSAVATVPPFHAFGVVIEGPLQQCVPLIGNLLELLATGMQMLFTESLKHEPPASARTRNRHSLLLGTEILGGSVTVAATAPPSSAPVYACRRPRRLSAPSNFFAIGSVTPAADGVVQARIAIDAAVRVGVVEAGPELHVAASCNGPRRSGGRAAWRRSRLGSGGTRPSVDRSCRTLRRRMSWDVSPPRLTPTTLTPLTISDIN